MLTGSTDPTLVDPPSLQDRLLGTLIVIVLRAKNLPNRVRIGKQNPYATVTYGLHKKRTETIERGGQQPTWDAEFRFEILKEEFENEQLESGGAAHIDRRGGVLPMSTKDAGPSGVKLEKPKPTVTVGDGRRILKLACWADDNRDPRLIGEGELNIEDTIRKGKFDDWVKLERKDRYAGEVYLELTWYSNEPEPKAQTRLQRPDSPTGGNYGGAGSRLHEDEDAEVGEERGLDAPHTSEDQRISQRLSQASFEQPDRTLTLAPDYPDADLAPLSVNHYPDADLDPLTRSMSSLSVGRPLPQPPTFPVPSQYGSQAPVVHSQTYSHLPPPSDAHSYNRERRTSFHNAGGDYPYQQYSMHPPHPPAQHTLQATTPYYVSYETQSPASMLGSHPDQGHYAQQPDAYQSQQQSLGRVDPSSDQLYTNHSAPPRPLPPSASYTGYLPNDPYGNTSSPHVANPYPPLPQPPIPPIPPSTSVYWQKQQQQLQNQQYDHEQHRQQTVLPSSATYSGFPSSVSHHQLAHSISHTTLHPSSSTPSFAQTPTFAPPPSFSAPPLPPQQNFPQSYSVPPMPNNFAPPPVFTPPPLPPSLQGSYPAQSTPSGPYPPVAYQQQQPYAVPSLSSRPPLPPPPQPSQTLHKQPQQHDNYRSF